MAKYGFPPVKMFKERHLKKLTEREAKPIAKFFHKFYLAFRKVLRKKIEKREITKSPIPSSLELYKIVKKFDKFLESEEKEKALFSKELNLVQFILYKAETINRSFKNTMTIILLRKAEILRENAILKLHYFSEVMEISQEASIRAETYRLHDIIKEIREEKDPKMRQKLIEDLENISLIIARINKGRRAVNKFIRSIKKMKEIIIDKNTKELIAFIKEFDPSTAEGLKKLLESLNEILIKQRRHISNLVKNINVIRNLGERVKAFEDELAKT